MFGTECCVRCRIVSEQNGRTKSTQDCGIYQSLTKLALYNIKLPTQNYEATLGSMKLGVVYPETKNTRVHNYHCIQKGKYTK